MTACRCGLNDAGTVRPSRNAANSCAGVSGCPLSLTPCLRRSWNSRPHEDVAVGSTSCGRGGGGNPCKLESARPARTLSSLPAAAVIQRGSGKAPLGTHVPLFLGGMAPQATGFRTTLFADQNAYTTLCKFECTSKQHKHALMGGRLTSTTKCMIRIQDACSMPSTIITWCNACQTVCALRCFFSARNIHEHIHSQGFSY